MEGDVELAIGADQVPYLGRRQGRGIVAERQPVRYPLGPDPRAKLLQRQRQPGQVLLACLRRQSDLSSCWYRGLLRDSGAGPNNDIAHLVPVECSDYGRSAQCRFTGTFLVAHATSSAGVAWLHA